MQMDAHSLAVEMAPVIMWQKGSNPEFYRHYWNQLSKRSPNKSLDPPPGASWDMLNGKSDFANKDLLLESN